MGKRRGLYNVDFPEGTKVKIASEQFLQRFLVEWKYHHKLTPEQIQNHDQIAPVKRIQIYHGGDELYELEGIPGIWHEQCLEAV